MRTLAVAVSTALLLVAGAANAAPSVSLIWTGTTGTGVTGGSSIDAQAGDVLTLDVAVASDGVNVLQGAQLQLNWDAADLTGLVASNCPGPPNAIPGTCTNGGALVPPFFSALGPIVLSPGNVNAFNAFDGTFVGILGGFTIGRLTLTVGATAATESVSVFYNTVFDGLVDSTGTYFVPGSATVVVPEPATAGLLALGLGALGFIGRRRS